MLEALEPVLAEVVISQSTSGRAMPADELAAIAVEVFGADRVEVAPRLDDAIDSAVALAEEEGALRRRGRAGHRLDRHGRRGAHPAGRELTVQVPAS